MGHHIGISMSHAWFWVGVKRKGTVCLFFQGSDFSAPLTVQAASRSLAAMQEIERLLEMQPESQPLAFEEFIDTCPPAQLRQICRINRETLAAALHTYSQL